MSESFSTLLDENLSTLDMQPGSIVSGVVLDIDKDWVTVHVGLKSEGIISLDEFRKLFQLEDKYPLFKDLNKWVIKPAVKEINDSSNLIVYYSTKKKGKNVIALEFDFVEDNQLSMSFN